MSVSISQLWVYPIKSCQGVQVDTLLLDALGAADDRRYMLVDENGVFVTQRQFASLVLISIIRHEQGWLITLPDGLSRVLPAVGLTEQIVDVVVWGDSFSAFDQGDQWAQFFSIFLQRNVRLIYTDSHTSRCINNQYSPEKRQVNFADGFPLLIVNKSSLDLINQHLDIPITAERFRPNIVVVGAPAFAEQAWKILIADDVMLALVKPCSRCVIPTINLSTAKKEKRVWQVLEQLCKKEDGAVYFGMNVIHSNNATLSIGQCLTISA